MAAQRLDKSALDPHLEDREVELAITMANADNNVADTVIELVSVPPDTSVVEYWLKPTSMTEQITVRVRIASEALSG